MPEKFRRQTIEKVKHPDKKKLSSNHKKMLRKTFEKIMKIFEFAIRNRFEEEAPLKKHQQVKDFPREHADVITQRSPYTALSISFTSCLSLSLPIGATSAT